LILCHWPKPLIDSTGNKNSEPEKKRTGSAFPKSARLLKKSQYDRVFSRSIKVSDQYFLILMHQRNKTSFSAKPRLGLVISKKVDRRAVGRNRIKRLVRESFRQQKHIPACDFVVIGRPAAKAASNTQLLHSLDTLWHQASIQFTQRRKKHE